MKKFSISLAAILTVLLALLPESVPAQVTLGSDIVVEAGKTVDSAVSFGGKVTVYGTVTDTAVSLGDDVVIEKGGRVQGDAVSLGGDVTLKDSSSVGKDVVSVGGKVSVAPTAALGGEIVRPHANRFTGFGNSCAGFRDGFLRLFFLGPFSGVLGAFGTALLLFFFIARVLFWLAFAMLIYQIVPERVEVMARALRGQFGTAFLYGFLSLFLIPFLFLFLLVSLIGIPLIPLTGLLLFLLYIFGSAGAALWAGQLLPNASSRTGMINVVLGVLFISLIRLIPGVGFLVWLVLASISFGTVIITRLGTGSASA